MRSASVPPARLLSDEQAGGYTGTSKSYIRALIANGVLKPVELPSTDGSNARARLLRLDRLDIDRWLDSLPRQS